MATFQCEFIPKSFGRKVKFDVIIPSQNLGEALSNKDPNYYENRETKFPLVIFLCGFGENEKSWQQGSAAAYLCEKYKIAGVFIAGENKWYHNNGQIEDHYGFLEVDLLDFIYGNFKNLSREMPLGIAGVSMGGYGTLFHYLKNVDKYTAAAALSPATKPDFMDESKVGTLRELFVQNKDKNLNIYLSIGDKDFIYGASMELNQFLKDNDVPVQYKVIPNADHSWMTWNFEAFEIFEYFKNKGFISK